MNDHELLRRFAEENVQEAFATLVRAKVNLVYAAALRQVGGDAHLAQDVTQGVFLALAAQAGNLKNHPILIGWLFTTTHFLATKAVRGQQRWRWREVQANETLTAMNQEDRVWNEMRPVIDEALCELDDKDRTILLLRFFEGCNHAEVGSAVGISENAARMRTDRALDKLRTRLIKRGITSTSVALGTALSCRAMTTAPVDLATTATRLASMGANLGVGSGLAGTGLKIFTTMSAFKVIVGAAAAVALFAVGAYVGEYSLLTKGSGRIESSTTESHSDYEQLLKENAQLKNQLARSRSTPIASQPASSPNGSAEDLLNGKNKWKLLAALSKKKIIAPNVTFIDASGNLNADMASLFDLTPEEQAAIRQQLDETRAKIETLENENASVTRLPDGKIQIEVKPFPQTAASVYDGLMSAIAQNLGPERNAAFAVLCSDQVDHAMGAFGATERKVTVTSQPDSKGSRYLATDDQVAPNSHSSQSSNYKSREELLQRVGTITKLLPADF